MAVVKKISELVPKGSALGVTDLLVVGVDNGTDYDLKSVTGAQLLGTVVSQTITDGVTTNSPSENVVYDALALKVDKLAGSRLITSAEGTILGNTSGTNTGDQTLQTLTNLGATTNQQLISNEGFFTKTVANQVLSSATANVGKTEGELNVYDLSSNSTKYKLNEITKGANSILLPSSSGTLALISDLTTKVTSNTAITGATKTKITYDSKGLVTSGADATTADIADSLNKRYVTDANLTTIGNTSGTNTGDQDLSGLMVKSNNLSDLTNTTTARTNLGLGSLATQSGTFSGTSSGTNTGDQIISDATLTTSDITTNNFSTTKHGFVPKGTNTGKYLKDDGTWSTISAGGLTYFTEAQSTASPNATVNVDSLTAVASTTNADFAIVSKGTGALTRHIPDGTATGGNKRGANAVDLQSNRSLATQVANGDWSFVGAGSSNTASGSYSAAFGAQTTASGNYGSFSAGWVSSAIGQGSVAMGSSNFANGTYSACLGGSNNNASGDNSVSIGTSNTSSSPFAFSMGSNNISNGEGSVVFGWYSRAFGVNYRSVFGKNQNAAGDTQKSILPLGKLTTDATLSALSVDGSTPSVSNQLVLQNNNAMRVKGSIIAKQTGTTNVGAWDIDCVIVRGASASTTSIVSSNVNLITNASSWGTPTITANTTLGCLTINVVGATSTSIKWTCIIDTSEVIY